MDVRKTVNLFYTTKKIPTATVTQMRLVGSNSQSYYEFAQ